MSAQGQPSSARVFPHRDSTPPGGEGPGESGSLRRWLLIAVLIVVVVGGMGYFLRGYFGGSSDTKGKAAAMPPRLIRVAAVAEQAMPVQVQSVGTIEPLRTVAIRSRVDGHVTEIRVKPGDLVNEGQVLFILDQRPFRSALDQAQAVLGRDTAGFLNAKEELERQNQLMAKQLTTQEAFDRAKTAVEVQRQAVEVAKAQVDSAKLNLEFATVRAPITGRIGKPTVDVGSIVRASDSAAILTINQTHPIYATFTVPQRYLTEIRTRFGKNPLQVAVALPGKGNQSAKGNLSFVDNTVDPSTGTIILRATCDNPAEILWPGESVSVTLTLNTDPSALVVPPESVQTGPRGTYVYIAKPDNTVEYRTVTLDRIVTGLAVITDGLKLGEHVVLDGQLNLINGSRIQVVAANTPGNKKP